MDLLQLVLLLGVVGVKMVPLMGLRTKRAVSTSLAVVALQLLSEALGLF